MVFKKFKVTDNVEADCSSVYVDVFWNIFSECGGNRNRNRTGPSTHELINSLSLAGCGLKKNLDERRKMEPSASTMQKIVMFL